MPSGNNVEHFVTLFDRHFLPVGLTLLRSLCVQAQLFRLWVLCMDEVVERQLRELALPEVEVVPLRQVESESLLAVKLERSIGEYCWTLTSHAIGHVLGQLPAGARVTYLDADLYFFASPRRLFDEFTASGASVLITEHAYPWYYDQSRRSGIYCVQFMTFCNDAAGWQVLRWWQERCVEWCFARVEDGKFGDQKYLDDWPIRFGAAVHVLQDRALALGPWNSLRFPAQGEGQPPVFFHFHSWRLLAADQVREYWGYRISTAVRPLYRQYLQEIGAVLVELRGRKVPLYPLPEPSTPRQRLLRLVLQMLGMVRYVSVPKVIL